MEFDDLKAIWKLASEKDATENELSRGDVELALRKKSNTVISKIRAKLKLKIIIQIGMGIAGLGLAAFLFWKGKGTVAFVEASFFLTILILGTHKRINYSKIVDFQKSSAPLKESITQVIVIMNKVIKAQVYTTTILATFAAAWVTILKSESIESLLNNENILIIAIGVVLIPILLYYGAKYGQKQMFGTYLDKLKNYEKELKISENDGEPRE